MQILKDCNKPQGQSQVPEYLHHCRLGKLLATISSSIFSGPFSLTGTPIMEMLLCLMLFQRSLKLFQFLKFVSLFVVLTGYFPLFYLPEHYMSFVSLSLLIISSAFFISVIIYFSFDFFKFSSSCILSSQLPFLLLIFKFFIW